MKSVSTSKTILYCTIIPQNTAEKNKILYFLIFFIWVYTNTGNLQQLISTINTITNTGTWFNVSTVS